MQKKLSMFQIILLAVFGSLAVVGVLIFALATAGGGGGGVGPVTIWGTLNGTAMQAVLRIAAETDPRLSQVTYVQKDPSTYQTDLASALASGAGPDMFIITQDWAMRDAGLVAPLPYTSISQSQFTNAFVQSAAPFMGQSGIVAVPLLVDPLVLYWDRDLVANAGFAQPVRYWDELPVQAQKITQKDDSGAILKSAIDFGGYENVDNAKDILATLMLQAGAPITTRDNSGRLVAAVGSRGVGGAGKIALEGFIQYADPSNVAYTWSSALPEGRSAFAAQQLAYYVGYASEEPFIKQSNPNLNYAVTGVPQIRGAEASMDFAHVYGIAISKQSPNQPGALTIAALISSSAVSNQLSVAYGIPSARLDVLAGAATGNGDLYNKMAIISRAWVDPDPSLTGPVFKTMIEDTTSGAVTTADAVLRADQKINNILGL